MCGRLYFCADKFLLISKITQERCCLGMVLPTRKGALVPSPQQEDAAACVGRVASRNKSVYLTETHGAFY